MIRSLLGIRRPILFSKQKFTQDFDTRLMHYRPSFGRNPDQYGHIELIIGPMFAGKSTELLRRCRRYEKAHPQEQKPLIIKYCKDNRYDENLFSTHDGSKLNAVKCNRLDDIKAATQEYKVIAIDEGQFFPDIVEFCENLANNGKIVVVAGLDGTYQRRGFGKILELVPLAESVVKLTAICMNCRSDAAFSRRLGCEKEIELIGKEDKYMSVCRECYHKTHIQSPHKAAQGIKRPMENVGVTIDPKRKLPFDNKDAIA